MNSPSTSRTDATTAGQTTLLTSHKGVDLHAATALLVMKDRLEGGHLLEGLFRCEMHSFWGGESGVSIARLLDVGRYFNPNKHHYGHFTLDGAEASWLDRTPAGNTLDPQWPGSAVGTDLETETMEQGRLYDLLLGGESAPGITPVDVVSFPLGQEGPVLSGVLWRLLIRGEADTALEAGRMLAVASGRKEGLLINPHMEAWLAASR
ncbi:MAG: hypothetical protein ABFS42_02195 [Candidatus Krumholzibacteriota bacterium]